MKKHNLFKVVMITILVAALLTWILPVKYINNQTGMLTELARSQVGIFNLFEYLCIAVQHFSNVGLYILVIGGLYAVLHKIDAYRAVLNSIVKSFKNNEWLFMLIVMVLFSILSAFAGLSLPLLVLFPFVISVVLMMGYDKITAALITVGSVIVGLIGSVYNVSNTLGIDLVLETAPDENVLFKLLLFVVSLALLIYNVLMHAKKHRDTKNLVKGSYIPEKVEGKVKTKTWPLIVVMDILFIVMVLGFISWSDVFEITFFKDVYTAVTEFEVFGFPIFGKILGLSAVFGQWSVIEMTVAVLLASIVLAFMYKVKFNDYIKDFMDGAKRALKPAILVILVYTVLVLLTNSPVVLTIVKPLIDATKGLNVATMSLTAIITSIFNVDLYYGATSVLPYVTTVLTDTAIYPTIALIWQAMYGLIMLVAPTSVILLATLSYLHISYKDWLKSIWKLFIELAVILIIIITIVAII